MTFHYREIDTPVGKLYLVGDGEAVSYISFEKAAMTKLSGELVRNPRAYQQAVKELEEYFAGERTKFGFPISLFAEGFNRKVLTALKRVGFGKTVSYKELARRAGSPSAFRAAGAACGRNPLPIVIPCHRVTNSDGRLGGWSGRPGAKEKLLLHEHNTLTTKGNK